MAGDRELLLEIDVGRAHELLESDEPPVLIDVREQSEWDTGRIAGALHIPMGELGENVEPYRGRALVLYCARGNRSLRAAEAI